MLLKPTHYYVAAFAVLSCALHAAAFAWFHSSPSTIRMAHQFSGSQASSFSVGITLKKPVEIIDVQEETIEPEPIVEKVHIAAKKVVKPQKVKKEKVASIESAYIKRISVDSLDIDLKHPRNVNSRRRFYGAMEALITIPPQGGKPITVTLAQKSNNIKYDRYVLRKLKRFNFGQEYTTSSIKPTTLLLPIEYAKPEKS